METKHTKGEWIVKNNDINSFEAIIYNNNNVRIAEVKSFPNEVDDTGFSFNDATKEERQANAKLIAAAPDLLQHSIKLIQQLKISTYLEENGHNPIYNDAFIKLEQAIKKATI